MQGKAYAKAKRPGANESRHFWEPIKQFSPVGVWIRRWAMNWRDEVGGRMNKKCLECYIKI